MEPSLSTPLPEPGQVVRVRSRQYLVEEVVPAPAAGQQSLVRLSCLDDDAQGTPLEVLWERELDAELCRGASWQAVAQRGFDPPRLFSAYYHTLRWNCVTATNPRLFQAPYRAGIRIDAYQLEPLRKALLLPRVNLFIADDVGLGKTIEAGLIVRELLMRQKVRRIVVACPPSMVLQWRDEMEARFGLTFAVFDRQFVLARRRERGYSVNPWTTHSRFLISHALLRNEEYAGPLRDWLGEFCPGSLLVLDEAHHAAPASSARYAIDSDFTKTVRDVAPRFEHRLFLSATPHNGHSNSFSALLEILDPQRFCRGVPVKSEKLRDAVMVRRLKSDLAGMCDDFPRRDVVQVDIDGLPVDAPELALSTLLAEYRRLREQRFETATKRAQAAAALVVTSLQKRLLSSIEAFASTLRVHRRAVERQRTALATPPVPETKGRGLRPGAAVLDPEQGVLAPPDADDDRAELPEDEVQAEEETQVEAATELAEAACTPAAASTDRELVLLDQMSRIAEQARGLPDSRTRHLIRWLRENLCPGIRDDATAPVRGAATAWNDRRVLIFTEYADTKRYLEQQLRAAIVDTEQADARIATFHGGMGDLAREEIKKAFNRKPAEDPLRILIATDAAREGVNLQNYCADLFHFDVPWNPSRMEQRNGRIDRKLQRAKVVRCHYYVLRQRPEDRVLEALVRKTKTIQEELGSLSTVLDDRLACLLERGISREQAENLARSIDGIDAETEDKAAVDEELEVARERQEKLTAQLEGLRTILEQSRIYLGLDEPHFRDALSCSLQVLGAEPLKNVDGDQGRWEFPTLDRRAGADPSWSDTLDTLRAPRRPQQKLWEWRKESPIRPIVFADPGTIESDVVHLHLEHRVVQRLLGRFISQGFVHDDLSRACVAQSHDAIRRVLLLGRLSLYGERAARLHDEIVVVAARWQEPSLRRETLRPYAGEAEERTLELMEASLGSSSAVAVPEGVRAMLVSSVERDLADLLPHLKERSGKLAFRAEEKLLERGVKEAAEMVKILEDQRARIGRTLAAGPRDKLADQYKVRLFGEDELRRLSADERRQLDADRRHWQRRLETLDQELTSEPDRIRANYHVKARRIEPVGIVYLWPVSA